MVTPDFRHSEVNSIQHYKFSRDLRPVVGFLHVLPGPPQIIIVSVRKAFKFFKFLKLF